MSPKNILKRTLRELCAEKRPHDRPATFYEEFRDTSVARTMRAGYVVIDVSIVLHGITDPAPGEEPLTGEGVFQHMMQPATRYFNGSGGCVHTVVFVFDNHSSTTYAKAVTHVKRSESQADILVWNGTDPLIQWTRPVPKWKLLMANRNARYHALGEFIDLVLVHYRPPFGCRLILAGGKNDHDHRPWVIETTALGEYRPPRRVQGVRDDHGEADMGIFAWVMFFNRVFPEQCGIVESRDTDILLYAILHSEARIDKEQRRFKNRLLVNMGPVVIDGNGTAQKERGKQVTPADKAVTGRRLEYFDINQVYKVIRACGVSVLDYLFVCKVGGDDFIESTHGITHNTYLDALVNNAPHIGPLVQCHGLFSDQHLAAVETRFPTDAFVYRGGDGDTTAVTSMQTAADSDEDSATVGATETGVRVEVDFEAFRRLVKCAYYMKYESRFVSLPRNVYQMTWEDVRACVNRSGATASKSNAPTHEALVQKYRRCHWTFTYALLAPYVPDEVPDFLQWGWSLIDPRLGLFTQNIKRNDGNEN